MSTSHVELDTITDETTINDDNNNVNRDGDDVVTDNSRPAISQESVPELKRPTPERQHRPRDGRHHDAHWNVPPPPEPVVPNVSYATAVCRHPLQNATVPTVIRIRIRMSLLR